MSNESEYSMGFIIGSTRRIMLKELNIAFIEKRIPLTMEQYILLYTIHNRTGEITQQELATQVCKDKSAILRTIDILEAKGLVKRHDDATDRRKKNLTITEKCKKLFQKISKIENETMEKLKQGISKEDYEVMVKVMYQIQSNANK